MAAVFEATGQLDPESQAAAMIAPLAIKYGCRTMESLAWYRFAIRYRRAAHLLGRAYGIPSGSSDAETRAFVADQFNLFLNGSLIPAGLAESEISLLDAVRTVITSA